MTILTLVPYRTMITNCHPPPPTWGDNMLGDVVSLQMCHLGSLDPLDLPPDTPLGRSYGGLLMASSTLIPLSLLN